MSIDLSYIAQPVSKATLKKELNENTFVRKTNKGNNEIYIVNHHNSPNVMREIGRLRELTFASAGGGTGLEIDIDEHDTATNCYQQLIVFSPEDEEIIGGYRFIDCNTIEDYAKIELSTQHYFNFSEEFIDRFLPKTIELGRSWIQPAFQPSQNPRKGLFALDNLWDGLGAISVDYQHIDYFFGKVTMYTSYNTEARNAVLSFMHHYFPDSQDLVQPIHPIENFENAAIKTAIADLDFKEGLKELNKYVKERGENIPPLINQYMQLSSTMKTFGTAVNKDFGGVEETGILVRISDIYESKKDRHIESYTPKH
ncbi:MAG: GNAT family N-acetyltransferase [Flavobacteriales bacterium]|jgi:hypothetical protein|nr:GNAT family N-acetyltransferase [Flavobacteriales bacterium]